MDQNLQKQPKWPKTNYIHWTIVYGEHGSTWVGVSWDMPKAYLTPTERAPIWIRKAMVSTTVKKPKSLVWLRIYGVGLGFRVWGLWFRAFSGFRVSDF